MINTTFSGHETFPFRYGWLKKGVDAVQKKPAFFASERAMIDLGVGKNMVQSIRYWCSAAGLIAATRAAGSGRTEHFPTKIGNSLIGENGFDPHIEDPATLWLIHWQLASNLEQCTTWHWLFNLWHSVEITKEQMYGEMQKWLERVNGKLASEKLLKRDIDVCLRTYVQSRRSKAAAFEDTFDCPLTELNLVTELEDNKTYQFQRGEQKTLPNQIFLFALGEFWRRHNNHNSSIALEKIVYDAGSPGKIFKLDEDSTVRRLDEIAGLSGGAFVYGETAGLKQVYRHKEIAPFFWLENYYQERN